MSRSGAGERAKAAEANALQLAREAVPAALEEAGLEAGDIDCIVTTQTTWYAAPGIDVRLIHSGLGLRYDIERIPMATLGCVGGAHALKRAAGHVRGNPGARVLVVGAENPSTLCHPDLRGREDVLYAGLFGDSAGACVVTDAPLPGRHLEIGDVWEYVLPGSEGDYWAETSPSGLVAFRSGKSGPTMAGRIVPHVRQWLGERPVDWAGAHPGSESILRDVVTGLGLDFEEHAAHGMASLTGNGNLGGVAVLDVVARTLAAGPPQGPGMVVAYGPGGTAAVLMVQCPERAAN